MQHWSHFEAHFYLGLLYQKKNRLDLAERMLQKALILKPGSADVQRALGVLYEAMGDSDKAEIAFENVPGADADCIMEMDVDTEHGAIVYEIEIKYDGSKHEFEIDGATGKILKRSDEGVAN